MLNFMLFLIVNINLATPQHNNFFIASNSLFNSYRIINLNNRKVWQIHPGKDLPWAKPENMANHVEIRVKDNGPGIPLEIKDKIFQPFFTTKPTGQGTGLGLSLAYDIVKAHGGDLRVETKEGEGSEFIIILPNKNI